MVPPSIVIKVTISMPEDVREGALAPAQSTDVGHVSVALPPLVTSNVKEHSVDLTLGNVQTYTLSGNQTLTFDNPSATGNSCSFTLIVTNGGSATLTWPGAVDWAGGSAPSLTSSGIDILTFMTVDAGTIWYGFAAGLDMG